MKFIIRLIFAIVVFVASFLYFSIIFPKLAALAIALVIVIAEVLAPALTRGGSFGGGARFLLLADLPLLVWPGAALLLRSTGFGSPVDQIALASIVAVFFGFAGVRHGSGKDQLRYVGVLIVSMIALYSVAVSLLSGSSVAIGAALIALGEALIVARAVIPWPTNIERIALGAALLAFGAAVVQVAFMAMDWIA